MALVGPFLYVANTDAVVRFPYAPGDTEITAPGVKVLDLPGGPIDHHWTKDLIASRDGARLYVTVGSNSNVGENGLDNEVGRAAIHELDLATGRTRIYASGLRNPNGLAWEPRSGALWVAVNERDEIGSDLVPDYMTSVRDGGFYGWPYTTTGSTSIRASARRDRIWSRGRSRPTTRSARIPLRSGWRSTMPAVCRRAMPAARSSDSTGRGPQAAQRLQGDLRAVHRRPPRGSAGGRADRIPEPGRQGLRQAGRRRG